MDAKKTRVRFDWQSSFPFETFKKMLPNQERAFAHIDESGGSALIEAPTGSGKTVIGYTFLSALQ